MCNCIFSDKRATEWSGGTDINSLCARIHTSLGKDYEYDVNFQSFIRYLRSPRISEKSMSGRVPTLQCGKTPAIVIIYGGYINTFYIAEENKDEKGSHDTDEVDTELDKLEENVTGDIESTVNGEKENKIENKNGEAGDKNENVVQRRIRAVTDQARGLSFTVRKIVYLTPIPYPDVSHTEMKKMYNTNKKLNSGGELNIINCNKINTEYFNTIF